MSRFIQLLSINIRIQFVLCGRFRSFTKQFSCYLSTIYAFNEYYSLKLVVFNGFFNISKLIIFLHKNQCFQFTGCNKNGIYFR